MTLNQILYFHRAATLEHFNLAADSLHISEPSLSRSISSLEEELGVSLFEKTGRNIVLTKAGKLFLEQATIILDDISNAKAKMSEYTTSGGHIDIAYVSPLAHHVLPNIVKKFKELPENKDVHFSFHQGYTDENIKGLRERKYDLTFGADFENHHNVELVPFYRQEMVVIMPENNPDAKDEYVDSTVFTRNPILRYDPKTGLGKATTRFFQEHNIFSDDVSYFPDESSLASFVAGGFGIALVSDSHTIYREGIVVRHLVPEERFYNTVYMSYLKNVTQMPAVRRMIEFICNEWDHRNTHTVGPRE